jgi:glucosamine--fructose-6-phosphate aminotransferase (isomerizing)
VCGIIAAVARQNIIGEVLDGLSRLEYRGYDSAGLSYIKDTEIVSFKTADSQYPIDDLKLTVLKNSDSSNVAVAHTRWATHGIPSEVNAHPHLDCTNKVSIVHNGIMDLKSQLAGHNFKSDTDSEIIAHLIEEQLGKRKSFSEAFLEVTTLLKGTWAIVAMCSDFPEMLLASRHISPLVIGQSDKGFYIASDVPALIGKAEEIWVVSEDQTVEISPENCKVIFPKGASLERFNVTWSQGQAEKNGHASFMEKEIIEQPNAVLNTITERQTKSQIEKILDSIKLNDIKKCYLIGCGSSYHAALFARYALENLTEITCEADIASEFRYRKVKLNERCLLVAFSQSGETIDTLQAVKDAKRRGAKIISVVNVLGSSIARESDYVLDTRCGLEIGVCATKTYTSQLAAGLILASVFGLRENSEHTVAILNELKTLPKLLNEALLSRPQIHKIADRAIKSKINFFIGRQLGYVTALEGALKLKEIAYLPTEAYPAGELKHGPLALIDSLTTVIGILSGDSNFEKTLSNLSEAKSRGAYVVCLVKYHDPRLDTIADDVVLVPGSIEILQPVIDVVPLQFLAYEIASRLGNNVDRPRNLAKTVTVE